LLDPQYVQQFIEEYETLMKESIIWWLVYNMLVSTN
jgi:hypothetical protein